MSALAHLGRLCEHHLHTVADSNGTSSSHGGQRCYTSLPIAVLRLNGLTIACASPLGLIMICSATLHLRTEGVIHPLPKICSFPAGSFRD